MSRPRPRPVVRFPRHVEREYAARLVRRLALMRRLVIEVLSIRRDNKNPDDRDEAAGVRTRVQVAAVERAMPSLPSGFGEDVAERVDLFTSRSVARSIAALGGPPRSPAALGVDVEAGGRLGDRTRPEMRRLHVEWARTQVALIQNLEQRTWTDVAESVAEAVATGRTDLAAVLRDRFGVAETRARLIARDQVGSLNARITESRQRQAGILAYEWSSSGDERVRPLHRQLDGTVRRWDDPHPTEGHPGDAIQCRCVAIAVLDEALVPAPQIVPPPQPVQAPPPAPLPQLPATFGDVPTLAPPAPPPAPAPAPAPAVLDLTGTNGLYWEGMSDDERREDMVRIFGRDVTAAEIVSWTGVEQDDLGQGAFVTLDSTGHSVAVTVRSNRNGAYIKLMREYTRTRAEHHTAEAAGNGLRLFTASVERLRSAGFTRITTHAARSQEYNGYYTWFRYGYDSPFPARLVPTLPPDWQSWFPAGEAPPVGQLRMLEVMSSQAGRDWWRANGESLAATFDLDPTSPSSVTLREYQRAKGARRDAMDDARPGRRLPPMSRAAWEAWRAELAEVEQRARREPGVEDPGETPEDRAAADRAWQRIGRKGWR